MVAVCAFAPSLAQEHDPCYETLFSVSRHENSCQDFFVCMLSRRVDFSCDHGEIFDEQRIACRRGDADTCAFFVPEIPSDACDSEFLRVNPHPDPDDCVNFFICLNFNLIRFRCDPGYIFDRHYALRCIPGEQATCRETPGVPFVEATPFEKFQKNILKIE